jgi:pimeloyl-ACP methyl ester carboxylesterase
LVEESDRDARRLAIERMFIVGHELGGRLGFHLSLRHSARVRGHLALNARHPYSSARRLAAQAWREWWTVFVETPLLGRTVVRRLPAFTRLLFRLGNPSPEAQAASAVEQFIATLRDLAFGPLGGPAGEPGELSKHRLAHG